MLTKEERDFLCAMFLRGIGTSLFEGDTLYSENETLVKDLYRREYLAGFWYGALSSPPKMKWNLSTKGLGELGYTEQQ